MRDVAQWIECLAVNQEVGGSIPLIPANWQSVMEFST